MTMAPMTFKIEVDEVLLEHGILFTHGWAFHDDIFLRHNCITLVNRQHLDCYWMVLK